MSFLTLVYAQTLAPLLFLCHFLKHLGLCFTFILWEINVFVYTQCLLQNES